MVSRSRFFWLIVFVAFLGQLFVWNQAEFIDRGLWERRIQQLETDLATNTYDAFNPVYSGHPGMPAVLIAVAFQQLPLPPEQALPASVALLSSFAIAGAALAAARTRPASLWWFVVVGVTTLHPLLPNASPTNANAAALGVFVVLWALQLYESPPSRNNFGLLAWGLGIGVLAVTRLETAVIIAAPLVLLLLVRLGPRPLLIAGGSALAAALIFDPLLWFVPIEHLGFIVFRSGLNLTAAVPSAPLEVIDFTLFAPLALLGFSLTCAAALRASAAPFPRPFIIALVGMTLLFTGIFLSVRAQSLRHFQPIIFIWEVLLAQTVIHLLNNLSLPKQKIMILEKMAVAMFVGGEVFLLLYILWL